MVEQWNGSVESPECSQIHSFFKRKTAAKIEKSCGKTKGREEKPMQSGQPRPPLPWLTPRAGRGGLCLGRFRSPAPLRFGACLWSAGLPMLGHFGPLLAFLSDLESLKIIF